MNFSNVFLKSQQLERLSLEAQPEFCIFLDTDVHNQKETLVILVVSHVPKTIYRRR